MSTETIEQMRARLDQYGVKSEDVDFVVAIVAQIDEHPWLLPLSLMALAKVASRIRAIRTGLLVLTVYEASLDEYDMKKSTT